MKAAIGAADASIVALMRYRWNARDSSVLPVFNTGSNPEDGGATK
jgi:hypothetical protein